MSAASTRVRTVESSARSGHVAKGNLPAELTTFIGRRRRLQDVKSALSTSRLVTLVGPGGVGKTRLALRAAAELQRAVADGAWLVELAGLHEGELVPKEVMTALGLRDQSGTWTTALLVDYLRGRRVLLVLDNCEHLLDACAVLTDALLRETADLRILATSRQPLQVAGEQVLPLSPLGLPDDTAGRPSPESVAQSEAVALLVERAAQAAGDFTLTDDNRAGVVELVRHLDGMPLAIELAAGRLRTMGVNQILERLGDRFRLLSGGGRTAPQRQQSLRAAIDWSYDLLDAEERSVLRHLSLFAGTFGLDAAEAVCAAGGVDKDSVVDRLSALVDRSFVNRVGTTTEARYRLHETMREYAVARLAESDDQDAARRAFLDFYAQAAERSLEDWMTPAVLDWFAWMEQELDNIRAALEHCLATPRDRERGLLMVGRLAWYLYARAVTEGVYWLDQFLEPPSDDDAASAQALWARGLLSFLQADIEGALRAAADAEARARLTGDRTLLVWILTMRALTEVMAGDFGAAEGHSEEAGAIARAMGTPATVAFAALAEGLAALTMGDPAGAYPIYQNAADQARDHGSLYLLGHHLGGAGMACIALERYDEAKRLLDEAVRLARRLDDRGALIFRIEDMVCLAAAAGQPERAARLSGVTTALLREIGGQVHPPIRARLDQAEQRARSRIGDDRFERLLREGEALDREAAVALALEEHPAPSPQRTATRSHAVLGKREREVAGLVADGLSNKEIASRLFLSERTVETHVYNILNKLGFSSRVQIAGWVAAGE